MSILAAILCWCLALAAHAMLQMKILRTLRLPIFPRLPLNGLRLIMPFVALAFCCRLNTCCIVLVWFGTCSVAGLLSCLALTLTAHRQQKTRIATA